MKMLLALFLALAGQGVAGPPDANHVGFYRFENNLDDSTCNGRTMTPNGTIQYVAGGPAGGAYQMGTSSTSNWPDGGSALRSAWSNLSAWRVEFYMGLTSVANGPVAYYHEDDGTAFFQVLAGGEGKYQRLGARTMALQSAAGQFAAGNTYHVIINYTGTTLSIYKALYSGGSLGSYSVVTGQATTTPSTGTVTQLSFGRYRAAPGFELDGRMDDLLLSNIARSELAPSANELPTCSGQLSPHMWNSNNSNMFPNFPLLLLKLFLMPKNLPALEADSRPVATAVAVQAVRSRLEYTERLVSEGRITRTRTPTATPVSGTRAPSATATPTPDPNRLTPAITPRQR